VIPNGLTDGLAFTPDGRSLVAGSNDGGISLWDVARHVRTAVLQAGTPNGSIGGAVAVSPNGRTIAFGAHTGTNTYAVKLWSLASHRVTETARAPGIEGVTSVAFSPNGTQLAASDLAGSVRLWDARSGTPVLLESFAGHRYPVEHIAFSPDGATLASASDDGTIALWNTRGTTLGGVANGSIALAFSPDGKTLALSTVVPGHYVIALYSMPARKLAGLLPVSGLAALAFSPDGKTLAVAPGNMPGEPVELWNVATRRMIGQVTTGFTSRINSIAFSPDGTMLASSATDGTTVQVFSTKRLTRLATFSDTQQTLYPPHVGGVFMLAFSPDGRLLTVVGIDGKVRVYGVPGFSLLDVFQPLDSTTSLAFSPDGRELAFGTADGNVYVYSVPATYTHLNGQITYRGVFSANSKTIFSVEFLSNSSLIAAGVDSDVRFWHVPAGNDFAATTPAQTLATHSGQISVISYSAPLGLVATGAPNGTRVWDTNPARIAANICRTLQAPVRPILWREYLPDIPYEPVC
jgi:WD40 repeat protein